MAEAMKKLTYDDIMIGDLIEITKGRAGEVKWKGDVEFKTKSGDKRSIGIELIGSVGKHDGKWNGKRYFTCEAMRGMIVQMDRVRKRHDNPRKKGKGLGGSSKDLSKIGLSKKRLGIEEEKPEEQPEEHEFDGWGSWTGADIAKYVNGRLSDHGSHFKNMSIGELMELKGSKEACRNFFKDLGLNPGIGKTLQRYLANDLTDDRKEEKD